MIRAFEFYQQNPKGKMRLPDGGTFTFAEFRRWFREKLNEKINSLGRLASIDEEKYDALAWDARIINGYFAQRLRMSGCRNLLRSPKMKARYPEIDNQIWSI
jgi:hypothetical protein